MKVKKRWGLAITLAVMVSIVTACGGNNGGNNTNNTANATNKPAETTAVKEETGGDTTGTKKITLGFSQVGAESGWRTANTISIQDSAKEVGFDLKFSDAQQKQENQIKAIRSFIQQKWMPSHSHRLLNRAGIRY